MRVALIENMSATHHGLVGVALHEAGALIEIFQPWRDGRLPAAGDHDAVVAFGGAQNALDDALHPYLPELARLMAEKAAMGQAVLGICLGSQILARGLGAENRIGTAAEFGWVPVHLAPAAGQDPVLRHLPATFPIFQWHSDTFTLPPGAQHLATTPSAAMQCFKSHRAAYGMQFHFEASRAVVAHWSREFSGAADKMCPGWADLHQSHAATRGVAADAHGLAIARAWVALI